ncbi:UBC-like protein [Pluteus cervinus]|uniref:UBC-like protein n=1 Tax=Pluteus cervinus TaxID=181527 RepID=A0ACD3B4H2_9AGAR|nr:UBC-like protein [Pluteus cervinus]
MTALNKNNSAVKRIMQEARELANDPCTDYSAAPLEDDIFEWHCTLRGPAGTEYEGGLYHFRILLPAEYPFRPPSIMMLTPNGRFELNTKICISFTSYHEELWQPAWGVRTAILGLQGFFPLKGQAAVGVGSIENPVSERKRLAALSRSWTCSQCQQSNLELLPDPTTGTQSIPSSNETSTEPNQESAQAGSAISDSLAPQRAEQLQTETLEMIEPQPVLHNVDTLLPATSPTMAGSLHGRPAYVTRVPRETGNAESIHGVRDQPLYTRRGGNRPPLILDTAICVLVVLACAMFLRRMV